MQCTLNKVLMAIYFYATMCCVHLIVAQEVLSESIPASYLARKDAAVLTVTVDNENKDVRTATGGFINTILIMLTIIAFIGNACFLIYVFWLSK